MNFLRHPKDSGAWVSPASGKMISARGGALARIVRATWISIKGLRAAVRTEAAFRLELLVLVLLIPAAWTLTRVGVERALLIGSWLLVMIVELINSAIETVVDRIGSERHDLSGRAKDLGSAAVFAAIVLAVSVWLFVLFST
jgi:diacylglycerol kinase (ATP)